MSLLASGREGRPRAADLGVTGTTDAPLNRRHAAPAAIAGVAAGSLALGVTTQTATESPPQPDGATGYHTVQIAVREHD